MTDVPKDLKVVDVTPNRWIVAWSIVTPWGAPGRLRKRTFRNEAEADGFRAGLLDSHEATLGVLRAWVVPTLKGEDFKAAVRRNAALQGGAKAAYRA